VLVTVRADRRSVLCRQSLVATQTVDHAGHGKTQVSKHTGDQEHFLPGDPNVIADVRVQLVWTVSLQKTTQRGFPCRWHNHYMLKTMSMNVCLIHRWHKKFIGCIPRHHVERFVLIPR
jgi:hypothetical protein